MPKTLRIKILLVDDRENNLLSMESILYQDGYELTSVRSGKEALKLLLKEMDFTLILMDVEMPELNGFETASMIYQREKLRHIPIIFITAHSYGDENEFKGYKTGAVDYIYKPIQPELLRAKVSVFVELYKKNHQLIAQEQKLLEVNQNLEKEVQERVASEEKVLELNKQLLKNIEQLESTNKELDRFAFIASHDLQEPLRKIITFSDLIKQNMDGTMPPDSKLYLEKIQSACGRMQLLIKDILEFSKVSVEKESLVLSDLNTIIDEVISDMDVQVQEKKVLFEIDKLPKLKVHPRLMRPLFQNLISNAIKYSRKESQPVIQVSSKIETPQPLNNMPVTRYCRIYVKDNGLGFEQEYAEQIFTMFKRLHTGKEYQGTGIGLAICKKIVEGHKGHISASSAPGKGSTFVISLPVN